jgi:hypothetical protein
MWSSPPAILHISDLDESSFVRVPVTAPPLAFGLP